MQSIKATLLLNAILFFLACSPASCWVGQISARRSTPTQTSTPTQRSELFYKNDGGDELGSTTTTTTTTMELSHALLAPKPINLPKHSPPREVIARTKMMLDMEMMIGRMAMVSFFLFLAGEVFTGLTAPQLLNSMFLWR